MKYMIRSGERLVRTNAQFSLSDKYRTQPIGFSVLGNFGWLDNDYKLIHYKDYDKAFVDGVWSNEAHQ